MHKAFWHISSNFGDIITPYLFEKLSLPLKYVDKGVKEDHYIMCGSILPACNEHSIIWGAGVAQDHTDIEWVQPKEILAVRGKHTRDLIMTKGFECPEVYGDPAQILPLIYKPEIEKKRSVGIVPHMADQHLYTDFIDITQPVERFIDSILECELIKSSSLHAIIVADAYGLKWEWIPSDNVIGHGFKFRDFIETEYNLKKFIDCFPFKHLIT